MIAGAATGVVSKGCVLMQTVTRERTADKEQLVCVSMLVHSFKQADHRQGTH